jgi:hypothetical protein
MHVPQEKSHVNMQHLFLMEVGKGGIVKKEKKGA